MAPEVAVAKACGSEFATRDRLQECDVVGVANAQGAHAAVTVGGVSGDLVEELRRRGGVLDRRQSVEISVVGALGYFGAAVEIGDSLTHGPPGQLAVGAVVERAKDFEVER